MDLRPPPAAVSGERHTGPFEQGSVLSIDAAVKPLQTVPLGSSSSAIVEFVAPEAGNYVMVDHRFANASQGVIAVGGKLELEFESKSLACHTIAGGDKLGPDLYGVTRARRCVARALAAQSGADAAVGRTAKQLLDKYKVPMPNQNLDDAEIKEFIAYFKWADANVRVQAATQPQPAAPNTALPPGRAARRLAAARGPVRDRRRAGGGK